MPCIRPSLSTPPLHITYLYRRRMQPSQVDLKIIRSLMTKFKNINSDMTIPVGQQPGQSQTVSAIITLATIDRERSIQVALLLQPRKTAGRSPLHQVDGSYRLMFHGIRIPCPDLLGRKYFHAEIY